MAQRQSQQHGSLIKRPVGNKEISSPLTRPICIIYSNFSIVFSKIGRFRIEEIFEIDTELHGAVVTSLGEAVVSWCIEFTNTLIVLCPTSGAFWDRSLIIFFCTTFPHFTPGCWKTLRTYQREFEGFSLNFWSRVAKGHSKLPELRIMGYNHKMEITNFFSEVSF